MPSFSIQLRSWYIFTAEGQSAGNKSLRLHLAHVELGVLPVIWFNFEDFEGSGLHCLCRKMERKLLGDDKDSKPD